MVYHKTGLISSFTVALNIYQLYCNHYVLLVRLVVLRSFRSHPRRDKNPQATSKKNKSSNVLNFTDLSKAVKATKD